MKIIIDISDEKLLSIFKKHGIMAFDYLNEYDKDQIAIAIAHGTPLPKGHGRLIDADKLDTRERGNNSQRTMWWNIDCIVKDAPTIVEADKENDNGTDSKDT